MMIPFRCRKSAIMIALLMLLMIVYSVKDSRAGIAPPLAPLPICPGADNAIRVGWLDFLVTPVGPVNFVGADLFLAELVPDGFVTGGVDWFYASIFTFETEDLGANLIPEIEIVGDDLVFRGSFLNTTITGSQLISKYNQKDTRKTFIEVANTARGICKWGFPDFGPIDDLTEDFDPFPRECGDAIDCVPGADECECRGGDFCLCELGGNTCTDNLDCNPCLKDPVEVHVEILDETCTEICNFCDAFTPRDKYVYDLSNLTRNIDGSVVGCRSRIAETEGMFVVTAVKNCASRQQARDYNFLYGDMRLIDPRLPADYGENLQTRLAISSRGSCRINGESCWFDDELNFPDFTCLGDNCEGAVVGVCNTNVNAPCFNNEDCEAQGHMVTCNPIAGAQPVGIGTCSENTERDCQNLVSPCNFGCGSIDGDTGLCIAGNCGGVGCMLSDETCNAWNNCDANNECILDGSGCDGIGLDPSNHCLTGELGCELISYLPNFLRKDFSVNPDPTLPAGADVVKLAIRDVYLNEEVGFRYRLGSTTPGDAPLVTYAENQWNDNEDFNSCDGQQACYDRVGINDALPLIDPPNPIVSPTPTPTPTPPGCTSDADCTFPEVCVDGTCQPVECTMDDDCPPGAICSDFVEPDTGTCIPGCTDQHPCPIGEDCVDGMCVVVPPPTQPPTPTPTSTFKPFFGGGCVLAGAPVQLGTAMANILIPLVPALAIGFRMIRRKKKKGQK